VTKTIRRDIVVVGASAGGLEALRTVLGGLPDDFPAAVFIVMHLAPESPNLVPQLLDRVGPLPVESPNDGQPIEPGRVYVAPPDRHLLIGTDALRITHGPKENRFRPSVDALFRSAAYACGPRTVGVILTGNLDDGVAGLWAVKDRGGVAIVQDPREAPFPSMPSTALQYVEVDHVLPVGDIAPALMKLSAEPVPANGKFAMSKDLEIETRIAQEANALDHGVITLGDFSPYTCPDCSGVMVQVNGGGIPRFRCHTGHAFSIQTLLAAVTEGVETEMWQTLRALDESVLLMQHMARHLREEDQAPLAEQYEQAAAEALQRGQRIRQALANHEESAQAGLQRRTRPKSAPKTSPRTPRGKGAARRSRARLTAIGCMPRQCKARRRGLSRGAISQTRTILPRSRAAAAPGPRCAAP
jgi:two-component system chemotaxis response regulator CheB